MYYQHNVSQVEHTIQQYKHDNRYSRDNESNQPEIPTKFNPSTGQLHQWNEDRKCLSRFPISFRGCFICGSTYHRELHDCPIESGGNYDKKTII